MMKKPTPSRKTILKKPTQTVEEAMAELKSDSAKTPPGYRQLSLAMHGHHCAKCQREFPPSKLHLLTVHHKDSDPNNNPPDGSNWENLCAYCHEDEHSRELLGDYEQGGSRAKVENKVVHSDEGSGMGSMADLFANARKKK